MKNLLLIVCSLLVSLSIFAQSFNDIISITTKINYNTLDESTGVALMGGVDNFISVDQGVTWSAFDNSVGTPLENIEAIDAAIVDNLTYCIIGKNTVTNMLSVARTNDGGNSWTLYNTVSATSQNFSAIQSNGTNLVIAAKNGVYFSIDGGISWTFITLSSGGEVSNFVDYNMGSGAWFVGSYDYNVLTSIDQGLTWNPVNYGFPSSEIVSSSNLYNQLLFVQDQLQGDQLLTVDANNTIVDSVYIPQELLLSWPSLNDANYLPNGDIIACNNNIYYIVDTSNAGVYHIDYPTTWGNAETNLALGNNYGIASRYWPIGAGTQHAFLIDYLTSPPLHIPSDFYIVDEATTCAGDNITAIPYADYGDSVQWYVNGSYFSSDSILNYPTTPNFYTSYTIDLFVYYNGSAVSASYTLTFSVPQPPHSFTYQTDTIVCYDQPHYIFIDPSSGTPQNTVIEVYYGGQLVVGPQVMTNNNMYLYTTPLNTSDTLYIISMNTGSCDNTADTIAIPMTLGPDMLNFTVIPFDSAICLGDDAVYSLLSTDSIYTYDFTTSYSIALGVPWNTQQPGMNNDTLIIQPEGLQSWIIDDPSAQTYSNYFDMYVTTKVFDGTTGCWSPEIMDTFFIYRPTAYYELHSRSFYQQDTVHLSNAFVTDNRVWSSMDLSSNFISNVYDSVPLIIPDTTGIFDIRLNNEPISGCADSVIKYVQIANPAPQLAASCNVEPAKRSVNIHKIRIDQFGNQYEIGANRHPFNNEVPFYTFRKYSPNGALLWEKIVQYTGWGFDGIKGIVMEDVEFDCDGNPVCAIWISGDEHYTNDYINFDPPFSTFEQWCLVVKVNKINGDLIWSQRVNDLVGVPIDPPSATDIWRITDLVVDHNNGDIHFATYGHGGIRLSTIDSDGNFINNTFANLGSIQVTNPFVPASFQVPTGALGSLSQSHWSPQLEILSTGVVIGIGYQRNVPIATYPSLDIGNAETGMFGFKYSPSNGVYDLTTIAQLGREDAAHLIRGVPHVEIDKNDNITFVGHIEDAFFPDTFQVLDSFVVMSSGMFIVNMDTNYNINWLAQGTFGEIMDFERIESTGEYYFAYKGKDNASFGNGSTHIMVGEDVYSPVMQYTSLPDYSQGFDDLDFVTRDIFLAKFDSVGTPLAMELLKDPTGGLGSNFSSAVRLAGTPCGDLNMFVQNNNAFSPSYFDWNGQVYTIDSASVFKFRSNCPGMCTYFSPPDTLKACYTGDTVIFEICEYYNVGTVVYDLYFNGNLVGVNQTQLLTDQSFDLSIVDPGIYEVSFSSPVVDTTIIIINAADTVIEIQTACDSYTWIDGNTYTSSTNAPTWILTNAAGCDSVIILNLTINVVNNGVTLLDTVNIQANTSGALYQWVDCNNNFSQLNGETNQTFTATQNGSYAVVVTENGCTDTSACIVIGGVGIVENALGENLTLYPNPTTGELTIELGDTYEGVTVKQINLLGQVVKEQEFKSTDRIETFVEGDPGVYQFEIYVDDERKVTLSVLKE